MAVSKVRRSNVDMADIFAGRRENRAPEWSIRRDVNLKRNVIEPLSFAFCWHCAHENVKVVRHMLQPRR